MKIGAMLLGIFCFYGFSSFAGELPANPWAAQTQTVRINTPEKSSQKQQTSGSAEDEQYRQWINHIKSVERNNQKMQEEMAARAKAERERRLQEAEAAKSAESGGFLDKVGEFFSDDGSSSNSAPSQSSSTDSFEMPGTELLQGYDNLKNETEKSVRKLKRNFNSLTNINIEKTIDDTLKSLQ